MTATLAPPDVEAALKVLLGAKAHTRTPNPRPADYLRLSATGGRSTNPATCDAQVLVESFAKGTVTASQNARNAWHAITDARGSFIAPGVWLVVADCSLPVNFPDPDTTDARYQFVASLTVSMTEAP